MDRLPQVNPDLLFSKEASRSFRSDSDEYKNMKRENPYLFALIEVTLDDTLKSDDYKEGYCKAALQFYSLLSAQLECDNL